MGVSVWVCVIWCTTVDTGVTKTLMHSTRVFTQNHTNKHTCAPSQPIVRVGAGYPGAVVSVSTVFTHKHTNQYKRAPSQPIVRVGDGYPGVVVSTRRLLGSARHSRALRTRPAQR